jgi:hypothetical protein
MPSSGVLDGKYMVHILAGGGDTHHILAMPGILLAYFIYRNKNVCSYFQRDYYQSEERTSTRTLKDGSVRWFFDHPMLSRK